MVRLADRPHFHTYDRHDQAMRLTYPVWLGLRSYFDSVEADLASKYFVQLM
jgi:hypothetical protein